jgi:hypothetical protein
MTKKIAKKKKKLQKKIFSVFAVDLQQPIKASFSTANDKFYCHAELEPIFKICRKSKFQKKI